MNLFSFFSTILAQQSQFELPPGEPVTYASLTELLDNTAKFLYGAGVTLAVITLAISGIMYLKAGDKEADITKAKGWFKNGIIGVFIILAIGVIINTIKLIVEGGFF
ncbi:MAG: hypothetical protein HYS78_01040 [Parcubacteria group bacterium]|nr:hypothetical protein [Parcubacteria group bacterium]